MNVNVKLNNNLFVSFVETQRKKSRQHLPTKFSEDIAKFEHLYE